MIRHKMIVTLAGLLLCGIRANGAAPKLPEKAIGPDTIVVIHMGGATLTPDALRQAAEAVLGDNAARANDQIAKYQEKYDKAIKAGVQSMTFVGRFDPQADAKAAKPKPAAANAADQGNENSDANNGVAYIRLKPGADTAAIQKMLSDEMDPAQKAKTVFNKDGEFLVMHQKDEKLNASGDRTRMRQFAEAINQAPAAGIVLAFVPNQGVRDKYQKEDQTQLPPFMTQAMPAVLNSKWVTLAMTPGKNPSLTITDNAADDASAKLLTDSVNAGLTQMKEMAQQAQNGQGGAGNPMAMMLAPMLAPLADAMKPTQAGTKVTVTLQGPALGMIAQTGMQLGAMFGNMGAAGAGRPGAGGGQ